MLQEVGGADTAHLQAGGVLAEMEADLIKKSHQMARWVELCCYQSGELVSISHLLCV